MTEPTTPQLTEEAVREIEARTEAATKGPWHTAKRRPALIIAADKARVADCHVGIGMAIDEAQFNSEFLAHARTDIPALIRDWRALQTRLTACEGSRRVHELDNHHNALACGYCAGPIKEESARLTAENAALREQLAQSEARVIELERRLRIPFGKFPCAQCGGPHDFDTSIPSAVWNRVIRARDLPDYLCATCIVREFVRVGQGFTAELWNEEFNGVPIELIVNGQNAKDAALVQEENNSLRNQINDAAQSIVNEADKVAQLMQAAATRMRDKCVRLVEDSAPALNAAGDSATIGPIMLNLIEKMESLTLDQVEKEKQQS